MNIFAIGESTGFASQLAREMGASAPSTVTSVPSGLSKNRKPTLLVVEMSSRVSLKSVMADAQRENAVLLLRKVKREHLKDVSLLEIEASTIILTDSDGGRRQQIVAFGASVDGMLAGPAPVGPKNHTSTLEALDSDGEESRDERPLTDRAAGSGESDETSEVREVADWLSAEQNVRHLQTTPDRPGWDRPNASRAIANVLFPETRWNSAGTKASIYGSFDVELIAASEPRKKFVRIRAVDCHVRIEKMHYNTWDKKGHFTCTGRMMFYPGQAYTFDKEAVTMPAGWRRTAMKPETPNSKTTYTKTTGMSIGEKGSGKVSDKGAEVGVELSVGFSTSATESATIEDFQVMNRSSQATCDWEFWHSSFFPPDSPDYDQITTYGELGFLERRSIKTPPSLSLTALPMECEAVFEAPADAHGAQRFVFYLSQVTAIVAQTAYYPNDRVEVSYAVPKSGDGQWNFVDVNLDVVRLPRADELDEAPVRSD